MKIIFETLYQGVLVTVDGHFKGEEGLDIPVHRELAFESRSEAYEAVGHALLDNVQANDATPPYPPAPTSAAPAPSLEPEAAEPTPPPPTRRVGLMQPKKSGPPAGRIR